MYDWLAYASTIDTVIYSPKLFSRGVNHALDASCIRYIDREGKDSVFGISCELFAFFRRLLSFSFLDIREDDSSCSGLGKGKRGLPTNSSGSLKGRMLSYFVLYNDRCSLTPVITTTPSTVLVAIMSSSHSQSIKRQEGKREGRLGSVSDPLKVSHDFRPR